MMPIDGDTPEPFDYDVNTGYYEEKRHDPQLHHLPYDNNNPQETYSELSGMLNYGNSSLGYQNWKNGENGDLGMKEEDIRKIVMKELGQDGIFDDKYTEGRLYEIAHQVLTTMEKMILNSKDIPGRAISTRDKNGIMGYRNDIRIKYNAMREDGNVIKLSRNSDIINRMIKDINKAENNTLMYFLSLNAKTVAEDMASEYKGVCMRNSNNGRIRFLNGSETYKFGDFTYILFSTGSRREEYLDREGGVKVGVTSMHSFNRGENMYRVDYNFADQKVKDEVKKILPDNKDLKGIIHRKDGSFLYTYIVDGKEYNFNLSENDSLPIGNGVTIQEERGYRSQKYFENVESEKYKNATLDGGDFRRDFAGDDFNQFNIGNCWELAAIDSFVNFFDYEELIRYNVKKNNRGGYDISLPLRYPPKNNSGKVYSIDQEDLLNQVSIEGIGQVLVNTNKIGIKCLVVALANKLAGEGKNFDFHSMDGGDSKEIFDVLLDTDVFNNVYRERIHRVIDDINPFGISDNNFESELSSYINSFNKETDMMVLDVYWPESGKREDIRDAREEYGGPHALSLDSVFFADDTWHIRVSNPHYAKDSYTFELKDFLSKCMSFHFSTKDKSKIINDGHEVDGDRFSPRDADYRNLTLNGYLQDHPEEWVNIKDLTNSNVSIKYGYKNSNGELLSEYEVGTELIYIIKSFNQRSTLDSIDDGGKSLYNFSINGQNLKIPVSVFSTELTDSYNEDVDFMREIIPFSIDKKDPDIERTYISAMKFAHFINYVKYKKTKDQNLMLKKNDNNRIVIPWQIFPKNVCRWSVLGLSDDAENYVDDIINFLNNL